jgi:alkanesulfonate monooxygenase SsuD/methylene tetrahydromethanopterin reductase-like flavin-dependent oxidoreductase (luciferase family)
MEFGIVLPTPADAWKTVKRAEALGFASAWFYDTQMLSADVFVGMAAAAVQTSRIRLGTGVLIPSNRIAPVAANALASLNQLAPGRIDFGVGTGFTGRRAMGLRPVRLADLAEYVRVVYALLGGETVRWRFEGQTRAIRFLNPELGLINARDPIPLHLSAFGPRSRELTARLGAGWINFYRNAHTARSAIEAMQAAWAGAGRPAGELRTTAMALGCVLAPGEAADSPRAKAQAGPLVTSTLHRAVEDGLPPETLPPDLQEPVRALRAVYAAYEPADARYLALHRGHLMFLRDEEAPYVTGTMLRERTLTGTAEEIREVVRELERAGYHQLAIQLVPGHEAALEDWARVFEGV